MRAYSVNELFYLTRSELFALHAKIVADLPSLNDGAPERNIAFENLRLVRWTLSRTAYPASMMA